MAVPGTGSTNQSLTFTAAKKLAGKAHTSNLKEIYNETIPSNVQLNTDIMFGEAIPQTVTVDERYASFSASAGADPTVEYVEFYVESIAGTTYDANTGSFGDVGFGGGDEAQSSGPHGFQLVLTATYESLSSGSWAGSGYYVNDQIIHESNGGLQLVNPSFGPQTGNNYGLKIYTAHPDDGGLQIPTTSPIEWVIDYFNGVIFVQDYNASAIPTYAQGFIYVGKTAKTMITEASSSSGGGVTIANDANNRIITANGDSTINGEANLTFDGTTLNVNGGTIFKRRAVTSHTTASAGDYYLGISATGVLDIRLPDASTLTAGQTYVLKDEAGNAHTSAVSIAISASTGQTIDGESFILLESPFAAISLYTNGSDKFFIY